MANFNKPEIIKKLCELEAKSATLDWHTPGQFNSVAQEMNAIEIQGSVQGSTYRGQA